MFQNNEMIAICFHLFLRYTFYSQNMEPQFSLYILQLIGTNQVQFKMIHSFFSSISSNLLLSNLLHFLCNPYSTSFHQSQMACLIHLVHSVLSIYTYPLAPGLKRSKTNNTENSRCQHILTGTDKNSKKQFILRMKLTGKEDASKIR